MEQRQSSSLPQNRRIRKSHANCWDFWGAAGCEPLAMGPWDRKPERSAGRLANYLDLHANKFAALALRGVAPRNYRKIPKSSHIKDLPDKEAA